MNVKGSYTLEAALLMPLILSVIVGILYLGFWLHDAVLFQGVSYEGASMGAYAVGLKDWRLEEPDEDQMKEYMDERIKGQLFLSESVTVEVSIDHKQAEVVFRGNQSISAAVSRPQGASYVRWIGRICKTLQKDKEGSE